MAALILIPAACLALLIGLRYALPDDTARMQSRAEALAAEGNWSDALAIWSRLNEGRGATWRSHLGEGKACLALGRAAQAERALRRAVAARPAEAEAPLLLLNVLRVEDRTLDAFALGWQVHDLLRPETRRELLRELTLCALSDLPDDEARSWLGRWVKADPEDVDARVALFRRMAAEPRSGDPDRDTRLSELTGLVGQHPQHLGAREALLTALADAGEPERGRPLLEGWPRDGRDGRYWRLKGRWELEHDRRPDLAVASFRAAIQDFPHDWRTHYRLARALQNSGQPEEARREAATVGRIREVLEPLVLGEKLDAAFAHLDDPAASRTLAELCDRAGLARLAEAWRAAGTQPAGRLSRRNPRPPDRGERAPAVAELPIRNGCCGRRSAGVVGTGTEPTLARRREYILLGSTSRSPWENPDQVRPPLMIPAGNPATPSSHRRAACTIGGSHVMRNEADARGRPGAARDRRGRPGISGCLRVEDGTDDA